MKLGVRERLFLASLLVILSVGLATGIYLERELRIWIEKRIEAELLAHAMTAQVLLEGSTCDSIALADPIADQLGVSSASRVTLIASDGQVLGDSEVPAEEISNLENHGSRPEVVDALKAGVGVHRRHSATLGTDMLYVAVPLSGTPPTGIVRFAMPLADVDRAIHELRIHMAFAGILGLAIAVFMTGVASHLLTRTLRALVTYARSVSRRSPESYQAAHDDILRLAGSFDQLTQELELRMSDLAKERDRSGAILECMSEALFALDESQQITLVNQAALDMLKLQRLPDGLSLASVTGVASLSQTISHAMAGKVVTTEFTLFTPEPRSILARAAPQRISGGCVVVMHDITEIRHMETVLRDFVANASHELRTPVSVIRANAETLLDGAVDNPVVASRLVKTLFRNAERLALIIGDLLDLSQLDAGKFRLEIAPQPIGDVLSRALELFGPAAEEKKLRVEVSVPKDLRVPGDEKALYQVLMNLLDNAVKFSPEGGLIQVSATQGSDDILLEVRDNGPGVGPEHRPRLFERFYRVDPGRSRHLGGTGLGLAIVKTLAEAMGAQVGMDPNHPRGSVFWIRFPRAEGDRTRRTPPSAVRPQG